MQVLKSRTWIHLGYFDDAIRMQLCTCCFRYPRTIKKISALTVFMLLPQLPVHATCLHWITSSACDILLIWCIWCTCDAQKIHE